MKISNKKISTLFVSLMSMGLFCQTPQATTPGTMEAINSASEACRKIIGIEIANLTPEKRAETGFKEEGVYVSAVIPKHPADVAGLKIGDVITAITGQDNMKMTITSKADFLEAMDSLKGGHSYPFEVYRGRANGPSQKLTLNVLVEKVPEKNIGKIS